MTCFIDTIDENTFIQIKKILETKLEDQNPNHNLLEQWKTVTEVEVSINRKKSETSKKIIEIAKKYFEKAGLSSVDEDNGYIKYISYEFNHPKYNKYNYDSVYKTKEEYGDGSYELVMIIQKDEHIRGGDLEVFQENPNTISRMFGLDSDEPEKQTFKLMSGMAFVCDTSVYHQFLNCGGIGQYNIIQVILYSM
jgi:hypothetical protein